MIRLFFPMQCSAIKILFLFLAVWTGFGFLPHRSAGQNNPDNLTVIYLKNGRQIECDMGWVEGEKIVYRKFGGNLALPLREIDLDKTFAKSVEREKEKIIVQYPGNVYQHEGVTLFDLTMTRELLRKVRNSDWGNQQYIEQEKTVYEILCSVRNDGNPCRVSVELIALDAKGYVLGSAYWSSSSLLWEGDLAELRTKVGMKEGTREGIKAVKVNKVIRSEFIPQHEDQKRSQTSTTQSSTPPAKTVESKGGKSAPNVQKPISGKGGRF
jgi:hypothetical protein